jgi:hypothetical protein
MQLSDARASGEDLHLTPSNQLGKSFLLPVHPEAWWLLSDERVALQYLLYYT